MLREWSAMFATLSGEDEDGLSLCIRGLLPLEDFLELTTATQADVVFVEAAIAYARRLDRRGGWLIEIGGHGEPETRVSGCKDDAAKCRRALRPGRDTYPVQPVPCGMVFARGAR